MDTQAIRNAVEELANAQTGLTFERWNAVSNVFLRAADEIERLNARLAAMGCFAGTLAVHVHGHFAKPDANSEAICKKWATIAQDAIAEHVDEAPF